MAAPAVMLVGLRDATGLPIQGPLTVSLTLGTAPPVTSLSPLPLAPISIPSGVNDIRLELDDPSYAAESVGIHFDSSGLVYCDSGICTWSVSGSILDLTISLGRISRAPCIPFPWGGSATGDQRGIIQDPKSPGYFALAATLMKIDPLRLLINKSIPQPYAITTLADADLDAWDRFSVRDVSVDLSKDGGFLWLEYGAVGSVPALQDPRFLIAVWVPPAPDRLPADGLDYVLFYSPSTATTGYQPTAFPFRNGYPYSVIPSTPTQPYITLGYKYLFQGSYFAQQSMGSGRPCIVVMPIFPNCINNPSDQWQPFDSQAGVYRLLLEVARFLHREGYGRWSAALTNWNGKTCGGALPSPSIRPPQSFVSYAVPPLKNVVLAGFSTGSAGLVPVLTQRDLRDPAKYPPAMYAAAPAGFEAPWREFWGLDLKLDKTLHLKTDPATLQTDLLAWLQRQPRYFRVYQSGYTTANNPPASYFSVLATKNPTPIIVTRKSTTNSAVWAEDWRDYADHWSLLYTSQDYLRAKTSPAVTPSFPLLAQAVDVIHPFMCTIGFGHAASRDRISALLSATLPFQQV